MVKELLKGVKKIYACEECNFYFRERDLAKKCEKWCRENKSCNLDITSHAIKN